MLTFIQRSISYFYYFVFLVCLILWTSICSDAERLFHMRDHSDLQNENQQQAEPITDPYTAEMFLSRYGFLKPVNWEEALSDDQEETDFSFLDLNEFNIEEGASTPHSRHADQNQHDDQKLHDPQFVSALRDFQKLSGLPVTGLFDEATKVAMNKPRCGVPDVEVELGVEELDGEDLEVEILAEKNVEAKNLALKSWQVQKSDNENVEVENMGDKNVERSEGNSSEGDLSFERDSNFEEKFKSLGNSTYKTVKETKEFQQQNTQIKNRNFTNDFSQFANNTATNVLSDRMDKMVTETKELPLKLSRKSDAEGSGLENVSIDDSYMTFANNSIIYFAGNSSTDLSDANLDYTDNFDPVSNQTLTDILQDNDTDNKMDIGRLDDNISKAEHSEMGNLNQTFLSVYNHSEGYLQSYNSTIFKNLSNETKENVDHNLNHTMPVKMKNSTLANLHFNHSFDQVVNSTDRYIDVLQDNNKNSTNLDNFTNFITNFSPVSKEATIEKIHQISFDNEAIATKGNATIDNLKFKNFANETLSSSNFFDPIASDTSIENMHQNLDKMAFAPKENSSDSVNFVSLATETNLNSLTIFDSIDHDTPMEKMHKNLDKMVFEPEANSTFGNIHFENFANETNLNSTTSFDPFDSNTTIETKRQTIVKTKENFTFDKFGNELANDNTITTTIFDSIINDTNIAPTKENSTFDNVNFDIANETNLNSSSIFDQTKSDATMENMNKNLNKTVFEPTAVSTFDNVDFENFTNETNLNSLTIFDPITNDNTIENVPQNVSKTENYTTDNANFDNFANETNLDSLTSFDPISHDDTIENMHQNVFKTTIEIKENYTVDNVIFHNFTNETNLNSSTIFAPIDNDTTIETKHQSTPIKLSETREVAQNGEVIRRKRHLATLVSRSRGRRRREAGGHVAFSKTVLRWRLIGEGYSSQLSVEEQRYVFRLAFRMWSEVCPLEFTEDNVSPLEEIDIRLGFGTGRHLGCKQRFDGSGREFAHAWFLGDIHFDDDEHFTGPTAGRGISLLKVAVHEIGHVLGLPHIYRAGSIMQPSYRPHEAGFEMDWMDRKAIQSLYGGCKGRFDTVFDWVRRERTSRGDVLIRFNTYFMRQGWYWLYENRNNRTRFGDPVSLQSGWRGLPLDGVDAFVHVWSRRRDHVYFFKGSRFWRYDSEQDQVFRRDPDGGSYPRPISEGFPGVPAPIDTAVYDRRDANIYFFKDKLVYAFSVDSNRLARGYPRPLRSVFPALDPRDHPESGLDAAYFSYTHSALFLFKGSRFWRVAGARERRSRPYVRKNTLLPHGDVDQHWYDICNVHPTALRLNP